MLTSPVVNRRLLLGIMGLLFFFSAGVIQVNAAPAELPAAGVKAGLPGDGPTGYIIAWRLNVRSGPGTQYPVLAVANFREVVSLTARNSTTTWLQIRRANGQQGWASAAFIVASAAHLAALPILDGIPPFPPEPTGYVTAYRLNIRSGPGFSYGIIGKLHRGQVVSLVGRNTTSSWLQIRRPDNSQGWLSARYIWSSVPIYTLPVTDGPTPPETIGYVTVPKLNVRSGPGTHYGIMGWLYRGQQVHILARSYDGRWLKVVIVPNNHGWVFARYIQSNVPDPIR